MKSKKNRFQLIRAEDRDITIAYFDTLEEAQEQMHKEMVYYGDVPEDYFDNPESDGYEPDEDESEEGYDRGYDSHSGWAYDVTGSHYDYTWMIVDLEEVLSHSQNT